MSVIVSPGAEAQSGWNPSLVLIFAPYVGDPYSAYLSPINLAAVCDGILWMVCFKNDLATLAQVNSVVIYASRLHRVWIANYEVVD